MLIVRHYHRLNIIECYYELINFLLNYAENVLFFQGILEKLRCKTGHVCSIIGSALLGVSSIKYFCN